MTRKICLSAAVLLILVSVRFSFGQASVHLTMGNPSDAKENEANSKNFLMVKDEFALSYNSSTGTANWVSWHLSTEHLGAQDRSNDFREDELLPAVWFHATATSYSKSGFDRGHLCPSGDRTKTKAANSMTFLMTNMVPQAPRNNRQTWRHLEEYSRAVAKKGNELYIIAGPDGKRGKGEKGFRSTIADKKVVVPNVTWKVIMVLKKGDDDVARVNASTRLIAVIMPNSQTIETDWTEYIVSVDEVEELTGFDFFSEVSDEIEDAIEAQEDDADDE